MSERIINTYDQLRAAKKAGLPAVAVATVNEPTGVVYACGTRLVRDGDGWREYATCGCGSCAAEGGGDC